VDIKVDFNRLSEEQNLRKKAAHDEKNQEQLSKLSRPLAPTPPEGPPPSHAETRSPV
jgi:hypothetical protein